MKFYTSIVLITALFPLSSLAENEVTFDPTSGIVTIPQVIILGDQTGERYRVELKTTGNNHFSLMQVGKTVDSLDTEVAKYITIDIRAGKRLVYGQVLRRIYSSDPAYSANNSLPFYVTNYVQDMEVRLLTNDEIDSGNTKTDRNGFYQLAIERAGNYKICFGSTNDYCGSFTIGASVSQRCDFNDLSGNTQPLVACTQFNELL